MHAVCVEPAGAIVYDDEKSCRESLKMLLQKAYNVRHVETEDNIVSLRFDLAIHRPRLLLLDYSFEGGLNLPFVAPVLHNFKGIGIIYSSVDRERVEKELGPLPYNFYFVKKGNLERLNRVLTGVLG